MTTTNRKRKPPHVGEDGLTNTQRVGLVVGLLTLIVTFIVLWLPEPAHARPLPGEQHADLTDVVVYLPACAAEDDAGPCYLADGTGWAQIHTPDRIYRLFWQGSHPTTTDAR